MSGLAAAVRVGDRAPSGGADGDLPGRCAGKPVEFEEMGKVFTNSGEKVAEDDITGRWG